MDQYALGWSHAWDFRVENNSIESFVRITARHKGLYKALSVDGQTLNCRLAGKMLEDFDMGSELPAVGDWCLIGREFLDASNERAAVISEVLPRFSMISRMVAGTETGEQILAANVDIAFIVTSVNRDFNINRLRRFVLLAQHGKTRPVIVLSKQDLIDKVQFFEIVDELQSAFPDVEYIATSSFSMAGLERINGLLVSGKTAVFIGSSGVGKSTLVNSLVAQQVQKTNEVRADDQRGRHTTSSSSLLFTARGGIIIDTPGLREVHVVGDSEDLDAVMPAVGILSASCRFGDCSHTNEPDCAVQSALSDGTLSQQDFAVYIKLERELAFSKRKVDQRLATKERDRWKKIAMQNRERKR